jgi:hypothetical protein
MRRNGILPYHGCPDRRFGDKRKILLMIDVEQFFRMYRPQKHATPIHEFEGVPFHGIVTGGNHDAAARAFLSNKIKKRGCGDHADDDRLAPDTLKPGEDRMLDHRSRRPRIAPHNDHALAQKCAERLRKRSRQLRRKRGSDDTAHARHADF